MGPRFLRLACVFIVVATLISWGTWSDAGGSPGANVAETSGNFDFSRAEDCARWVHISPGPGNLYADGAARMSAPRSRSFLLCTVPQERDIAVEVKATNTSGPALAWILLRLKNYDNFYEVALKKTHIEVWHKWNGEYNPILRQLEVELGDVSAPHVFKAQIQGEVPAFDVWLDGRLVWSGKEETGLEPCDGRYVALETEFSSVSVESVKITAAESGA